MKSYCLLANDSIEFRATFLKVSRETHYLGLGHSKLKVARLVNYFPGFWAKILRVAHSVNYSYLTPCNYLHMCVPRLCMHVSNSCLTSNIIFV